MWDFVKRKAFSSAVPNPSNGIFCCCFFIWKLYMYIVYPWHSLCVTHSEFIQTVLEIEYCKCESIIDSSNASVRYNQQKNIYQNLCHEKKLLFNLSCNTTKLLIHGLLHILPAIHVESSWTNTFKWHRSFPVLKVNVWMQSHPKLFSSSQSEWL